ncbi:MAG: nitrile hydratase subunit beta [Rhodobacteraceae bacterium]|nr:nitrile hydratase subunit beta [Paracoccaceae bacterium]
MGERVRTLPAPGPGHCRLPAYAAGRIGTIIQSHGNHVLPNKNARFQGEHPQPLYTVEFSAAELWGKDSEAPKDTISLDLWQPYLEKP